MATVNPLADQIKCSVCLDIYNEPHTLTRCLHTFCLKCIEQLERRGQIQCPECRQVTKRKYVKRDFKTQGFIDVIKSQQNDQSKEISSAKCGMCHTADKPVRYRCIECDHYMCDGCHYTHAWMKVCKDHKVESVAEIIETSEKHLKELVQKLEKEQKQLPEKESKVDKNILTIEECEKQQLGEVQQFTEDTIRDLRENEKRLNKIIKEANAALIRNLKECKEIFTKGHAEIQNQIDFLNDLFESQDVNTLVESADNITHSINVSIEQIQSCMPLVQLNVKSHVMVKKGEDWNVNGCIEVKVGAPLSYGSTALKPFLKSLYHDICKTEYVEIESGALDNSPLKLCQIKQEIWCCGGEKLSVYNKQIKKVKEIIHSELRYIRGMIFTNTNHVIVASNNGLHQLDINGQYQGQIGKGKFSDVSTYGEQIYALDYHKYTIFMFEYMNKWRNACELDLQYSDSSAYDKLCVSYDSIYVSSENGNCIYKYNFKGELQQQIRQVDNNLHLCGVDDRDNLLVAIFKNKQIQVYNREGSWSVVPLDGEISGPVHALLDDEGNFWVADNLNKTIIKFESK